MGPNAVLEVDLSALARNFHALSVIAGAPVHPVVKADAYGLGAGPVAKRAGMMAPDDGSSSVAEME